METASSRASGCRTRSVIVSRPMRVHNHAQYNFIDSYGHVKICCVDMNPITTPSLVPANLQQPLSLSLVSGDRS